MCHVVPSEHAASDLAHVLSQYPTQETWQPKEDHPSTSAGTQKADPAIFSSPSALLASSRNVMVASPTQSVTTSPQRGSLPRSRRAPGILRARPLAHLYITSGRRPVRRVGRPVTRRPLRRAAPPRCFTCSGATPPAHRRRRGRRGSTCRRAPPHRCPCRARRSCAGCGA